MLTTIPTTTLDTLSPESKDSRVGRPSKGPYHDLHVLLPQQLWEALVVRSEARGTTVTREVEAAVERSLSDELAREGFFDVTGVERSSTELETRTRAESPEGPPPSVEFTAKASSSFAQSEAFSPPKPETFPPSDATAAELEAFDKDLSYLSPAAAAGARETWIKAWWTKRRPRVSTTELEGRARAESPEGPPPSVEFTAKASSTVARSVVVTNRKRDLNNLLYSSHGCIVAIVAGLELLREQWTLEDGKVFIPREGALKAKLERLTSASRVKNHKQRSAWDPDPK